MIWFLNPLLLNVLILYVLKNTNLVSMNHFEEHKYDIKNETVFAPFTKGILGTVNTIQ